MGSSSSIIRELIPQLASSLGQLRRVPGKGSGWVTDVIATLERERDARLELLRRRLAFADRLAAMAGLSEREISVMKLGMFFHELLPTAENGAKASRPWREYLLRNEDWLLPALLVCEAVRVEDWQDISELPEVVAKIAVTYDHGTLERHERPFAAAESILASAQGTNAQQTVDLLWTEEGQALCDHHFRRHPRGYHFDPKDIRASLEMLYRATPRTSPDPAVHSMRFGATPAPVDKEMEGEQDMAQAETNGTDNFDRRRAALRTRTGDTEPVDGELNTYAVTDQDERKLVELPSRIEAKLREIESNEKSGEAPMNQLATVSATGYTRSDALDVRERLQQLRVQLGQIQQIAAQAEQLLNGIAPQIDEFAARIADVESVMDRWSGHSRTAA